MTNLQKAAEQGNQAAPNLLAAIRTGEVGGGGGSVTGFTVQYYTEFNPNYIKGEGENESVPGEVYTAEEALATAQAAIASWKEQVPNLTSLAFAAELEFRTGEDTETTYFYVTQAAIDAWLEKIDFIFETLYSSSYAEPTQEDLAILEQAKTVVQSIEPDTLFQADEEIVNFVVKTGSYGKFDYRLGPCITSDNRTPCYNLLAYPLM